MDRVQSISWFDTPRWSCKLRLGNNGDRYDFSVIWNTRFEYFEITLRTPEGEEIITGRKMVLEVDLLEYVFSEFKPIKCALIPVAVKSGITRITYDSMISGDIKLFSITQES